jgi:hypothetical protein
MIIRYLCCISVLLLSTVKTNAQSSVYHPFPGLSDNPVWRVDFSVYFNMIPSCYGLYASYQYEYDNDTIIGPHTYHRLKRSGFYGPNNGCPSSYYIPNVPYVGALRDDSLTRKVYYIPKDSLQERVLFDFSLQVGDTIPTYQDQLVNYPTGAYITSIDSVLIGSSYHKRFNLQSFNVNAIVYHIIEGVGSRNGLIERLAHDFSGGLLTCYRNGSNIFYQPVQSSNSCFLSFAGTADEPATKTVWSVYPNPAIISLEINSSGPTPDKLLLYNASGQLLQTISHPATWPYRLPLETYPEGLYFIRVISTEQESVLRFIHQR